MQIIAISRGSQSYGEEFAKKLAAKLGYACIGREEILEEAIRQRIAIGRLETAIIKPRLFSEELALELEHYKALATSILCEKALSDNIVYHGRTGHLLLPGIDHILKIRVIADLESRIEIVMQKLGLSRAKARQYVDQVESDRKRWVKQFYNMDWDVSDLYDLVINLNHMHAENAATAVCAMAQLPEFQTTPAITQSLRDLYLASRSRLLLARDKRTSSMNVKVRVGNGVVYVTYLAQQTREAEMISEVLAQLEGVREIICTQAETNILWIQEAFDPQDGAYDDVLRLANTWDAAVELMQITPSDTLEQLIQVDEERDESQESWREGGILEDRKEANADEPEGMSRIYEKLIGDGHAGGKRIIRGSQKALLNAVDRSIPYRLIILDKMFMSKGHAAQTRLLREWSNAIGDALKIPILSIEEIRARYQFGYREFARMAVGAASTALIIFLIFHFDTQIFSFLSRKGSGWRILATLGVFAFVPCFAYLYSTVTSLFLKMLKFD